jgi:hypothetical protein
MPKRKRGGRIKQTASSFAKHTRICINPTPVDPPSGQPRDKPVLHTALDPLFSKLLSTVVAGQNKDASKHDLEPCLAKETNRFKGYLNSQHRKKHKKDRSMVDYEKLLQSFEQFEETSGELCTILLVFREQQRSAVSYQPAFDSRPIPFALEHDEEKHGTSATTTVPPVSPAMVLRPLLQPPSPPNPPQSIVGLQELEPAEVEADDECNGHKTPLLLLLLLLLPTTTYYEYNYYYYY